MILSSEPVDAVFEYHDRTKHHLHRYAAGPGGLDWADQPDPFRRFHGCEKIALPSPGADLPAPFSGLSRPEQIPAQPLNRAGLGLLLELAFGLSAWKQYGSERWALRCNPSSGNLHPTEAYLVNAEAALMPPGVYHYLSHDHALEKRCEFPMDTQISGVYIALTSIHWREAWKYGERAYRYCQHDTGHALASLRYAAAVLGWSVELLAECGDDELAHLLGLNRPDDFREHEGESPDLICRIRFHSEASQKTDLAGLLKKSENAAWYGQAERLSKYHMNHWPVIDDVAQAALKPHTDEPHCREDNHSLPATGCVKTAARIIRQRRSAQRFDGLTSMPLAGFNRILSAAMPSNPVPFDVWRWPPRVHLLLFVHRVENLQRGLYLLPRREDAVDELKAAITINKADNDQWLKVDGLDAPLYRLIAADCRQAAKTISCHQDIASDGAFSAAMLADYAKPVQTAPWNYRRLFWETGLIGQALYLEAEAAGFRGTGIGCFFDDSLHEVLGFKDNRFQSLYHFTVGGPLDDVRLETLPPYGHLDRNQTNLTG
ncbi:MAG: SagB/ThcOx family dehydrogenase [Gammaproteobacteria bacterium]